MTVFASYDERVIDVHAHIGLDNLGYISAPYPGQDGVIYCSSCLNGRPESVIGYNTNVLPFIHTRFEDPEKLNSILGMYGNRIMGIGEIEFFDVPYGMGIMPWINIILEAQRKLGRRLPVLFHSGYIDERASNELTSGYNGKSEDYHDIANLFQIFELGLPITAIIAHAANPYIKRIPEITSRYNKGKTRVLFDTTGGSDIEDTLLEVLMRNPWLYEHIAFGSDGNTKALERMKRKLSHLPQYVQNAIFHGNMARELNM